MTLEEIEIFKNSLKLRRNDKKYTFTSLCNVLSKLRLYFKIPLGFFFRNPYNLFFFFFFTAPTHSLRILKYEKKTKKEKQSQAIVPN